MTGTRFRSPVVGCVILGVACVSCIAYYLYKRSRKRFFDPKKLIKSQIDRHNSEETHEDEALESSDFSDFVIVQSSEEFDHDDELMDVNFEEIEFIEDRTSDSHKVFRVFNPNKRLGDTRSPNSNSAIATVNHSNKDKSNNVNSDKLYGNTYESTYGNPEKSNTKKHMDKHTKMDKSYGNKGEKSPVRNGKRESLPKMADKYSDFDTLGINDEWTVLDNYTNIDGTCEEYSYVEKTVRILNSLIHSYIQNNFFSEEMDLQKNQSIPLTTNIGIDNLTNNGVDNLNNNGAYNVNGVECSMNKSINPSEVKIYLKNFGCSHNISDSEYMLGIISESGYTITELIEECDVVIINSCTVKNPSEHAMVNYINQGLKLNKRIIVTGCIPQSDKKHPIFNNNNISLLGIMQIDKIIYVIENVMNGNRVVLLEKKSLPSLDLPKIRKNKLIEIIPISTGCLGSCTFCKTKHSSYEIEAILDRVESSVSEGVKEIWLTSEDLGAYGIDLGTNIITLLHSIINILPQNIMLRLGMCNPPYIKKYINEICEILSHENVFEFIHIPVQSCSDAVLEKMNREYQLEDFLYIVSVIKAKLPNCTIATDIICGFPTETEQDHQITVQTLQQLKLSIINISQYYSRKGTISSSMKELDNNVKKNRSREITNVFMSYENNSKFINSVFKVFFNHLNGDQLVGYNKYYIKVIVKGLENPNTFLGTVQNVKVVNTHKWHLECNLIP
uniref:Threonylcarbamoyladenosine tRNA methylthiotransferase n=1 Tax=Theileria annulata TaxID=5874 RepID=A0A3B0MYK1_THEAN